MNPAIIKLLMKLFRGNKFTKEPESWQQQMIPSGMNPGSNIFGPPGGGKRNQFDEGGFIPELMKEPNPLGITFESQDEPKAHDNMDALMGNERLNKIVKDLVMGLTGGGGGAKGIRQLLLLMKGKIKGGKMIPSQPFRHGSVGKPNPSKLDIVLNKLKDNPNVGGHLNALMKENIKRHKR